MTDSRTAKSIRNSYTALFYNIITILLGFFSRKIFIDALGVEVLGLNTTAGNLLGFLNLAELGIGGAVAFTLYSPLAKDDRETINEIVAVQGWLYRRIAYFVLAGSAVLFCCFPIIFDKMELPLWYAYTSFGVLLFSSILGYFVNYRQIILSASQQQYKINNSVQGIKITKTVIQILGLSLLPLGYIFWLVVEFIAAMVTAWSLNRTVKRSYPWLKNNISNGRELLKKHSIVVEKIKQIFFHKIGGFALSQTSPIIIYAYISLSMVAIYGNYMLILSGLWLLNGALNDGIGAGVGNLVAEGNRERIMLFFREFTASRYCFATILSLCLLLLTTPFMSIWFGEEYLLDNTTFYIIIG
ncbi:MAG: sugar transporter, partial [Rikenellaceae bacterium]